MRVFVQKAIQFSFGALLLGACFVAEAQVPATPIAQTLRAHAATQTAEHNAACTAIKPFYWEVGDGVEALASGSEGLKIYTANTVMPIASASKWIFGAYVVQLREGQLSDEDVAALTMRSGYTNFGNTSCVRLLPSKRDAETVQECFQSPNPKGGNNSDFDVSAQGKFFYNGGHFQKMAVDLGLGADNDLALRNAIQTQLGTDFIFTYGSPQLAGGVSTSAANYAIFLRKILNGQLFIHDLLGADAVCTNSTTCATALYTPVPTNMNWSYSLGHWVESDPATGDGAFSSTGAFGFYPWIDANKQYYGIVARKAGWGGGIDSALCGAKIRKAWVTGRVQ